MSYLGLTTTTLGRLAGVVACAGFLAACQTAPQTAAIYDERSPRLLESAVIEDVPFFPQEKYHCGPAALATALSFENAAIFPDQLVESVFVPGREGTFQYELAAAGRTHGRVIYQIEPELSALLAELRDGNPVIVFQNLGLSIAPRWHFAVAKGYDLKTRDLILNSGTIENYRVDLKTFERTWARVNHWAVVAMNPGRIPASATPDNYLHSLLDYAHSNPGSDDLIQAYEAAVSRWPEHIALRMGLANIYLEENATWQGIAELRQVLQLSPRYAPAHNNIAHGYARVNEYSLALTHARQALEYGDRFREAYRDTLDTITVSAARFEAHK